METRKKLSLQNFKNSQMIVYNLNCNKEVPPGITNENFKVTLRFRNHAHIQILYWSCMKTIIIL